MKLVRRKVFTKVPFKVMNGTRLTGESLLQLARSYVDAINKGSVPCIESAWNYLCHFETEKNVKQLVHDFSKSLLFLKGKSASEVS